MQSKELESYGKPVALAQALFRTLAAFESCSAQEIENRRQKTWECFVESNKYAAAILSTPDDKLKQDRGARVGDPRKPKSSAESIAVEALHSKALSTAADAVFFAKMSGTERGEFEPLDLDYQTETSKPEDVPSTIAPYDSTWWNGLRVQAADNSTIIKPQPLGCQTCIEQASYSGSTPLYHEILNEEWFRLLIIEPGEFEAPIVCCLQCVCKSDMISMYEALSYSWHEKVSETMVNDYYIYCNGIRIETQPNLWLALRRIRDTTRHRTIWVDALCIDQSNNQERSKQVQSMASIYKNASRTLIWLGERTSPERIPYAFELIGRLVNNWDERKPACFSEVNEMTSERTVFRPSGTPTDCEALADLYNLSWFERKWVIQEVALSQSAQVMWGRFEMSWCCVGVAAAIMRTQRNDIVEELDMKGVYKAYLMFRLSKHGALPAVELTFLQLLRLTCQFKTSDPRDAIFALLGIKTKDHDPQKSPLVLADYTLSPEALFVTVAEKLLQQPNPLQLLANVEWQPEEVRERWFPVENFIDSSWIPTWGGRSGSILTPWSLGDTFCPAKGLQFQRFGTLNPMELEIAGIQVSTVMFCGSNISCPDTLGNSAAELLKSGAFGDFSPANLAVFARTLTAGRDEYGGREHNQTALVPHFAAFIAEYVKYWTYSNPGSFMWYLGPTTSPMAMAQLRKTAEGGDPMIFMRTAIVCAGRRLFVTTSGQLGLGPRQTLPGDVVCVLGGADMPFVIRKDEGAFRLIGECYVDDIMEGEAVKATTSGSAHYGPYDTELILQKLFTFQKMSRVAKRMMDNLKQDVLRRAKTKYSTLKMTRIRIR